MHRHAHATAVEVGLNGSADRITLELQDNGTGGAVAASGRGPDYGGFGLVGLRERVALLDGEIATGPSPHGGFCLKVVVPTRRAPGSRHESM